MARQGTRLNLILLPHLTSSNLAGSTITKWIINALISGFPSNEVSIATTSSNSVIDIDFFVPGLSEDRIIDFATMTNVRNVTNGLTESYSLAMRLQTFVDEEIESLYFLRGDYRPFYLTKRRYLGLGKDEEPQIGEIVGIDISCDFLSLAPISKPSDSPLARLQLRDAADYSWRRADRNVTISLDRGTDSPGPYITLAADTARRFALRSHTNHLALIESTDICVENRQQGELPLGFRAIDDKTSLNHHVQFKVKECNPSATIALVSPSKSPSEIQESAIFISHEVGQREEPATTSDSVYFANIEDRQMHIFDLPNPASLLNVFSGRASIPSFVAREQEVASQLIEALSAVQRKNAALNPSLASTEYPAIDVIDSVESIEINLQESPEPPTHHGEIIRGIKTQGEEIQVTIAIAHRNDSKRLRGLLASLAMQTLQNFEVVIVDDGSNQFEVKELRALSNQPWPFELLTVESRHIYKGAARNLAASQSSTPYIIFMDCDNAAFANQVELFYAAIEASGASAVSTSFVLGTNEGDTTAASFGDHVTITFPQPSLVLGIATNCYGDTNAIFRRDAFEKIGGFRAKFGSRLGDWDLFHRLVASGFSVESIPEPLFLYRINEDKGSNYGEEVLQSLKLRLSVAVGINSISRHELEALMELEVDNLIRGSLGF